MAENNNVPAVFAKSLKKVFVNKKNPALDSIALNGIDLTVPKGGLVALVGPDGAGKTTFMRLVCRRVGSVRYEHRDGFRSDSRANRLYAAAVRALSGLEH